MLKASKYFKFQHLKLIFLLIIEANALFVKNKKGLSLQREIYCYNSWVHFIAKADFTFFNF
jgi:hypothetical protein